MSSTESGSPVDNEKHLLAESTAPAFRVVPSSKPKAIRSGVRHVHSKQGNAKTLLSRAIGTRFRGYVCVRCIRISPLPSAALWAVNISKRRHHQRYRTATPSFATSVNIVSTGARAPSRVPVISKHFLSRSEVHRCKSFRSASNSCADSSDTWLFEQFNNVRKTSI